MRIRGQSPTCIACRVSEKTPETSAWEAMTVASAANATSGISAQCGANL